MPTLTDEDRDTRLDDIRNSEEAGAAQPESNTKAGEDSWENNVTQSSYGGNKTERGRRWNANNVKAVFKKKGAIGLIITILGVGGGGLGMLSMNMFLGQHLNAGLMEKFNSSLGMVTTADNNVMRVKLFSDSPVSTKCNGITCKYRGISRVEMNELKARGIKFEPSNGKRTITGKLTFDSLEIDGKKVTAKNFKSEIKVNSALGAKLSPVKNSLWKSFKNFARKDTYRAKGVSLDPDVSSTSRESFKRKIFKQVTGGRSTNVEAGTRNTASDATDANGNPLPDDQAEAVTAADNDASRKAAGELGDRVEDAQKAASDGKPVPVLETDLPGAAARNGTTIDAVQSVGKKAWGWVNAADTADFVCTLYKFANMAAATGRTVALVNVIRYGYIFKSVWDKQKAGEATQEEVTQIMNVITSQNRYGQLFDASAGARFLLHGDLSVEEPSTVSAVGSEALSAVTHGMYVLHTTIGAGNARNGRQLAKTGCNVATNLVFQGVATALTVVASVFTAGGAGAAIKGTQAAFKVGLTAGRKAITDIVKKQVEKAVAKVATKEARKDSLKVARKALRKQLLDPVNAGMMALILVETFGIDYIVQSLAGTDVLSYADDSVQTMDAIVTASASTDYASTVASGGSVQTIAERAAYEKQNSEYITNAIAIEKANANPFDVNDPYSKFGSFLGNMSVATAAINYSSATSLLGSLVKMQKTAFSSIFGTAKAKNEPTAQEIANYVDDPYMQEEGIAVDFAGNPAAGADLSYLDNIDIDELFTSAVNDGYIDDNGDPIAGSDYAKHIEECNNPDRVQIDETLFDGDQLQPKECRDGSGQRKYFNALTTYRIAISDDAGASDNNSEDTISGAATGELPNESLQELAKKIIDSGKVTFDPGVESQIKSYAETGKPYTSSLNKPCYLNPNILGLVVAAIDNGYSLKISSLNRRCIGLRSQAGDTSFHWGPAGTYSYPASDINDTNHQGGHAIDITYINGADITGRDKTAVEFINFISKYLPNQPESGFGQSDCAGGAINIQDKQSTFKDSCNHLHINVPVIPY